MAGIGWDETMTAADDRIRSALEKRESFVLDAGAGSGKTYSLISALNHLRSEEWRRTLRANRQLIACITYTNVAKDEILERTEHDELLRVATIHEFLWSQIRDYPVEMKLAVKKLNDSLSARSSRKKDPDELEQAFSQGIQVVYSEFGSNFVDGRISHDDLLEVARHMFEDHPRLSEIVGARFPIILVDEYQDTSELVVEILIDRLRHHAPQTVVGFFGDKRQAIYPKVVGELNDQHLDQLVAIKKEENYRCSVAVIDLLNKLRDDIQQAPAGDNAEGAVQFVGIRKQSNCSIQLAYENVADKLEDAPAYEGTKTLYLTHRLISRQAGYATLFDAYNKRGGFTKDEFQAGTEPMIRFIAFVLNELAEAWNASDEARTLQILQANGFRITSKDQLAAARSTLASLSGLLHADATVSDAIALVSDSALVAIPDKLAERLELASTPIDEVSEDDQKNHALILALLDVPFTEVSAYRRILQNSTPYSTQHGVKGQEFHTVLVVIDDLGANWNQYSFANYLSGEDKSASRLSRTGNLFYVSCSRAKVNLVVIDASYSDDGRTTGISNLFGDARLIL